MAGVCLCGSVLRAGGQASLQPAEAGPLPPPHSASRFTTSPPTPPRSPARKFCSGSGLRPRCFQDELCFCLPVPLSRHNPDFLLVPCPCVQVFVCVCVFVLGERGVIRPGECKQMSQCKHTLGEKKNARGCILFLSFFSFPVCSCRTHRASESRHHAVTLSFARSVVWDERRASGALKK